ncbi:MAG: hypothetical protein ABI068_12865 [Ktedonobacterales bacterium]
MSDPQPDAANMPDKASSAGSIEHAEDVPNPSAEDALIARGDRATSAEERYAGAVPPGYDWPTHGGYLGCLMGVVFALVLAPLGYIIFGFLGATLAISLGGFGVGLAAAITIIAYVALFIVLSRAGWRLGKHFLREYPQAAGQTWGEWGERDEIAQLARPATTPDQAVAEE